jgi:hypothetical protein
MKKLVFLGIALAVAGMLLFSCNEDRFDLDNLESIQSSGEWKIPIGSLRITLGEVLDQLGENNLLSHDELGNLQFQFEYIDDEVLKGPDFINLGAQVFDFQMHFENEHQGEVIVDPIMDTLCFSQVATIALDSVGLKSAIIKSGELLMNMETNIGVVSDIVFSSPGIIMPNGDTLTCYFNALNGNAVDISGATFQMNTDPVTGLSDSTLTFNYVVHYFVNDSNIPEFDLSTRISFRDVKIQEISGYVTSFVYDFSYDTTFSMELPNVTGEMELVGVELQVKEKNTFGFDALFQIDTAELYGEGVNPSPIFPTYPYNLEVISTPEYTNIFPEEPINLRYSTDFNGVRIVSKLIINPNGGTQLIRINENSSLGVAVNAVIPLQFNIPDVFYLDTIDINLSDINTPDLVQEVILGIIFKSEMPFNFSAQFYTVDAATGLISDSLMAEGLRINGSFDGNIATTTADISITQERLNSLMAADKLIMRLGVNTQNQNVYLNLDNAMEVIIKADVIYDGEIEFGD